MNSAAEISAAVFVILEGIFTAGKNNRKKLKNFLDNSAVLRYTNQALKSAVFFTPNTQNKAFDTLFVVMNSRKTICLCSSVGRAED